MPRYPALDSLWADAEHLNHAGGIGIYAAEGHPKVVLDQVSEFYTNREVFSSPGIYQFATAPWHYRPLSPNKHVGLAEDRRLPVIKKHASQITQVGTPKWRTSDLSQDA